MAFWGAFADPQTLRNHWLESMTGAMDGYLRSPAFMKSMQTSLKTATDVKAASDELVRNFARDAGILLASDIEDLSRRLDQVEHVISTRLEAIEARLMQIESGPGTPSGARQSA
jgi:PHP family Zn ribbon phosphoesterase